LTLEYFEKGSRGEMVEIRRSEAEKGRRVRRTGENKRGGEEGGVEGEWTILEKRGVEKTDLSKGEDKSDQAGGESSGHEEENLFIDRMGGICKSASEEIRSS